MRIHLLRFIILGTTALTACSSDQIIMESVTLSDLANTGCETRLDPQGNTIKIVIAPYKKDPTLEADCYCRYNVGFKLSNLTSGTYHLKVYFANYYGKYEILSPTYDGMIAFKPNETLEFDL